ncbi:alpha-hydroxy acid oxidase [Paraburkholderia sp. J12]|uniref:alpha-hydroxy acid oxidase n=1 Tax=Paraburkholderia sp. J12 TaxID=2805432 RepID=UPI002ABE65D1|nr:alpha-hydroxy acid oxidase [Paraburkholderia sp. J12]
MTTHSGSSARFNKLLSLDDFEAAARRHLPRPIFGYVHGAVEDNVSIALTRNSFRSYAFVPRTLVNVSQRSTDTALFGHNYAAPFGLAPMGLSALFAYRGDLVMARAARAANVPMIMSGSSLIRLEEVIEENPDAWFQAYLPGEDARIVALIERVKRANFKTLVITVDTAVAANRENNIRTGFSTPLKPSLRLAFDGITHPAWLFGTFFKTIVRHGMPHFENNYAERGAPILSSTVLRDFSDRGHLTWEHVERIRVLWPGTLIIKGILHADDARKAVRSGVDGIIVSNHGGRQLDGAIAPLSVLDEIVQAVPEIPVMLDSGVRRGTDVIKALALGARFVFVGRPMGYAAAIGGDGGVAHAIRLLREEVRRNMGLLGVTAISEINAQHVRHVRHS